ncbi:outer membrane protein assembly factor BamD [Candidatus Pelagibacter sp.]|nr:outer membrane protein assembly factor BamD [Candidatus Pelagibacter sp.]
MSLKIYFLIFFVFIYSCSAKKENSSILEEKNLESQMIEVYKKAYDEFSKGDVLFAGKKFNEVEMLYPQSIWASRSVLMSAYGYFSQSYYGDAINELERFLDKYKNHPNSDYAYYLLALCHYDQIVDEKKDHNEILKSKYYFEKIIEDYPDTDYAVDSKYKLQFVNEMLASKEMYLARYYVQREKWIPAINRFKKVVDEYETTIYVEEALHRLVEINYKIGLSDEALNYAALLGYNYQSSDWYESSYKIFNTKYKKNKKFKSKNKKSLVKKFRELFN